MWLEAEFQGSWHLYKTFPTPAISFSLWLSFFSFWLSLSPFLCHCLSLHVSPCFSIPSARLRVHVPGLAWPGLPVLVESTGASGCISGGLVVRLFGAPGTRLGKRVPPGRPPCLPGFGCCPPPSSRHRQETNGSSVGCGGRLGQEKRDRGGCECERCIRASVCECFQS